MNRPTNSAQQNYQEYKDSPDLFHEGIDQRSYQQKRSELQSRENAICKKMKEIEAAQSNKALQDQWEDYREQMQSTLKLLKEEYRSLQCCHRVFVLNKMEGLIMGYEGKIDKAFDKKRKYLIRGPENVGQANDNAQGNYDGSKNKYHKKEGPMMKSNGETFQFYTWTIDDVDPSYEIHLDFDGHLDWQVIEANGPQEISGKGYRAKRIGRSIKVIALKPFVFQISGREQPKPKPEPKPTKPLTFDTGIAEVYQPRSPEITPFVAPPEVKDPILVGNTNGPDPVAKAEEPRQITDTALSSQKDPELSVKYQAPSRREKYAKEKEFRIAIDDARRSFLDGLDKAESAVQGWINNGKQQVAETYVQNLAEKAFTFGKEKVTELAGDSAETAAELKKQGKAASIAAVEKGKQWIEGLIDGAKATQQEAVAHLRDAKEAERQKQEKQAKQVEALVDATSRVGESLSAAVGEGLSTTKEVASKAREAATESVIQGGKDLFSFFEQEAQEAKQTFKHEMALGRQKKKIDESIAKRQQQEALVKKRRADRLSEANTYVQRLGDPKSFLNKSADLHISTEGLLNKEGTQPGPEFMTGLGFVLNRFEEDPELRNLLESLRVMQTGTKEKPVKAGQIMKPIRDWKKRAEEHWRKDASFMTAIRQTQQAKAYVEQGTPIGTNIIKTSPQNPKEVVDLEPFFQALAPISSQGTAKYFQSIKIYSFRDERIQQTPQGRILAKGTDLQKTTSDLYTTNNDYLNPQKEENPAYIWSGFIKNPETREPLVYLYTTLEAFQNPQSHPTFVKNREATTGLISDLQSFDLAGRLTGITLDDLYAATKNERKGGFEKKLQNWHTFLKKLEGGSLGTQIANDQMKYMMRFAHSKEDMVHFMTHPEMTPVEPRSPWEEGMTEVARAGHYDRAIGLHTELLAWNKEHTPIADIGVVFDPKTLDIGVSPAELLEVKKHFAQIKTEGGESHSIADMIGKDQKGKA